MPSNAVETNIQNNEVVSFGSIDDFYYQNLHGLTITRSNQLVLSRFNAPLLETKVLALGMTLWQLQGPSSEKVEFTVEQLHGFTGIKKNSYLYSSLKKVATGLMKLTILEEDPIEHKFRFNVIVPTAEFSNGIFTIYFNPKLKPHLYNLKSNFSKMRLSILMGFDNAKKNNYAYRLYEILRVFLYQCKEPRNKFYVKYSVAEFISQIGLIDLRDEKISNAISARSAVDWNHIVYEVAGFKMPWYNIERRIIIPALQEINETTDIHVEYTTERHGHGGTVTDIIFQITKNQKFLEEERNRTAGEEENIPDEAMIIALENMIDFQISSSDAINLLKAAENDLVRVEKAYQLMCKQRTGIRRPVPWLLKAIKEGWEDSENPVVFFEGKAYRAVEEDISKSAQPWMLTEVPSSDDSLGDFDFPSDVSFTVSSEFENPGKATENRQMSLMEEFNHLMEK